MKKTDLLTLLGAGVLIFLLMKEKKPLPDQDLKITDQEIKDALKTISNKFGIDTAKMVESIFRNETRHFQSGQFLQSRSAGMVAVKKDFPYGWYKFEKFWTAYPDHKPLGLTKPFVVNEKEYRYIIFPSMLSAMLVVADVVNKGGANAWGGWKGYEALVSKALPRIVNSFT
jgi:hypothetical protein